MASWDPYAKAIVAGSLKGLDLGEGYPWSARRAIDAASATPDTTALGALRDRAGGAQAPGEVLTPMVTQEIEALAKRAVEALPESSRESLHGWLDSVAREDNPRTQADRAGTLVSRLVTGLLRDPALGERIGRAGRVRPGVTEGSVLQGRFRLVEPLGKGGFGTVWKAVDEELNEDVALKVLNPEIAASKESHDRFLNEVRATRSFVHKYAVQLREFGRDTHRNLVFFTMVLVEGPTLRKAMNESPQRRMEPRRAVRIARQILEALEEAHRAGLVHRDLKPENLVLTKGTEGEEEIRVLDFGIAKAISASQHQTGGLTLTGATVGTLAYMSPEQAQGEKLDGRADLYSVGAILYEALAGCRPIRAEPDADNESQSLLWNLATKPPEKLGDIVSSLPSSVCDAVMRALSKKAEERFPNARAFKEALASADLETASMTVGASPTVAIPRATPVPPADTAQGEEDYRQLETIGMPAARPTVPGEVVVPAVPDLSAEVRAANISENPNFASTVPDDVETKTERSRAPLVVGVFAVLALLGGIAFVAREPLGLVARGPDPSTSTPDPSTKTPDPTTKVPDPSTKAPDPTTKVPDPSTKTPDPTTHTPDPSTRAPDPSTKAPDPATSSPDPSTKAPDPSTKTPEPSTKMPEPDTAVASLPALSFLELDPGDGKKVLLGEPTLRVKGRLSDPKAGPVKVGEPGKAAVEKPLDEKGAFDVTLGLDPTSRQVEVRAGSGSREVVARIQVEISMAAPEVAIDPVAIWRGGPIKVSCKVNDRYAKTAKFTLIADGTAVGSPLERAIAEGSATATFELPVFSPNTLAVRVEAENLLGRTGRAEADISIDRMPPHVTIDSPEDGFVTREASVSVRAHVTSDLILVRLAQVVLLVGGKETTSRETSIGSSGEVVVEKLDLPTADGDFRIEVRASDRVGNTNHAAISGKIYHPPATPVGPALPKGMRLGNKVALPDGSQVQVYLWKLPTDPAGEVEMVQVSAGEFLMGEERRPTPLSTSYWIARFPTTWKQFRAFEAATGRKAVGAPSWGEKEDHPVVNVSWDDAKAFCKWTGELDLPTEAQWEKAARGTDGRIFPWGNQDPNGERCVFSKHQTYGNKSTAPVGSCPAGASPVGALDMAGNVWQWCLDLYEQGGSRRVERGGCFNDPAPRCRSFERGKDSPQYHFAGLGFRTVKGGQ